LTELREAIDSLRRHHASERPNEGVNMQADNDELVVQGLAQLCEQLEEDEYDVEMEVDEGGRGGESVADVTSAEEKHQPKHVEEEQEVLDNTATLPFHPTWG
jgi:hypothetical protein